MFDQNVLAMFGIVASMFVLYLLIWLFWLRLQVQPKVHLPIERLLRTGFLLLRRDIFSKKNTMMLPLYVLLQVREQKGI